MPKTGKGIYIKSNPSCDENSSAVIENIVYEDINITYPMVGDLDWTTATT